MIINLLLLSLAVISAGGIAALFAGGSGKGAARTGVLSCLSGALFAIIAGCLALWTGSESSLRFAWQIPFGSFFIGIDPLSAFFIITVSLACGLAAVYGTAYLKAYSGRKNINAAWCFFNLLFASMLLVILSRNGILFLIAWETMSLSSFFLVMFEHEKPEVREAGWVYIVASHAGQACLMYLFILLSGWNANLDFNTFSLSSLTVEPGLLFILAIAGFGLKAGFIPFHVWLPDAHPAAPSHVSAVMSGVMTKTGIYGIIRMVLIIGIPSQWWAYTLLVIGALSGITGVLFALAQDDIKRLLAYSSVENIGIITIGLGLWLMGISINNQVIAVFGITGSLLHVLNHSIFKSLLFFGAGAVVHETGTRNMNLLGGLIRHMPGTAFAFGLGSAAICGLPPLNGFISELLIYISSFHALTTKIPGGPVVAGLIAIVALSIIGGLAAACFTKVFGTVFLGESRSEKSAGAHEVNGLMLSVMLVASAMCIFIGLSGPLAVKFINPVVNQLLGSGHMTEAITMAGRLLFRISMAGGALIIIAGLLWMLRHILLSGRVNSRGPTWDCGYLKPASRMQYTASSFTWPVVSMFRWILRPGLHIDIRRGLFPEYGELYSHIDDIFQRRLFIPIFRLISSLAQRIHMLQEGRNQLYVLYIAVTILVLLLVKMR